MTQASPLAGLLGFWMLLRLVGLLAGLGGGLYLLYCLSRAAQGLERMADSLETWVRLQKTTDTPPVAEPFTNTPGAPGAPVTLGSPTAPVLPPIPAASTATPGESRPAANAAGEGNL